MVVLCVLLFSIFFTTADGAFVRGYIYHTKNYAIKYFRSNNTRYNYIPSIDDEKNVEEISSSRLCMLKDKKQPFLAILTEADACDTDERVNETYQTIRKALGSNNQDGVDLISIRVRNIDNDSNSDSEEMIMYQNRIVDLATRIMSLKEEIVTNSVLSKSKRDFIVVINDNVSAALQSNADGVHVKESKVSDILEIRKLLQENKQKKALNSGVTREAKKEPQVIIGTSAHSIESALSTWRNYKPDYFFVGTCYLTKSHPEKNTSDLEGPNLPGLVKRRLHDEQLGNDSFNLPHIFAIGGIDDNNCHEPVVSYGADGVAVIRAVMQASEPHEIVLKIKEKML